MAAATTAAVTAVPFPSRTKSFCRRRHCCRVVVLPVRSFTVLAPNSIVTSPSLPPSLSIIPNTQIPIDSFLHNRKDRLHFREQRSHELCSGSEIDGRRLYEILVLAIRHLDLELGQSVHAIFIKRFGGGAETPEDDNRVFAEYLPLANKLIYMYVMLGVRADARKVFDGLHSPNLLSYSHMFSAYATSAADRETVRLFSQMRSSGIEANGYSFVAVLATCIRSHNVWMGSQLHALATKTKQLLNVYVANTLLSLYVQSGYLDDAIRLLNALPKRDTSSWNIVISGLVKNSRHSKAFEIFGKMRSEGFNGDQFTVSRLLTAAEESLHIAEREGFHAHAIKFGLESYLSIGNAQSDGRQYLNILDLAIGHQDLELGKSVHAIIIKRFGGGAETAEDNGGVFAEDLCIINKLIHMYVKLGRLVDAHNVFDGLPFPNRVSYSTLLSAYAKSGAEREVIRLFSRMWNSGIEADDYSLMAIFSCMRSHNLLLGSQLQALATKTNYLLNVYVANNLMMLYVRSGNLDDAIRLFDKLPERDISSWNIVISGLVEESRHSEAFAIFGEMRREGINGDSITVSRLLTAAEESFHTAIGEGFHAYAIKLGLPSYLSVVNPLMSFYTTLGRWEDLIGVYRSMPANDIVSKTMMITGPMELRKTEVALEDFNQMTVKNCKMFDSLLAGFCHEGDGQKALQLFCRMVEGAIQLSDFTLLGAINACALVGQTEISKQMHAFVLKVGCGSNVRIDAALMNMFAKCNRIEDTEVMFQQWSHQDSQSFAWTSLISGYARNGRPHDALLLFSALRSEDLFFLDEFAVTAILGICGSLGMIEMGKQIQCYSFKLNYLTNSCVGSAICSMYSKCGYIDSAIKCFSFMHLDHIVSWNTLITANLLHRQGDDALSVWNKMETAGIKPDHISFTLILSACKYTKSKSVDTCQKLFASMSNHYGLVPSQEHYASMVRVLCHWDCFDEAKELIKNMPMKPDVLVWKALLDSCRLRSNVGLGRLAAQKIVQSQPSDPSAHVLITNLYSASGRWHCSEKAREAMRQKGIHKFPVKSWIVHQNKVHSFYGRDRSHAQSEDIYSALDTLIFNCMKAGYVPDTSFVLHEVEEYQKKDFLFYHSAKLAVTFGILNCRPGEPIKVMKNIVLCGDCHLFFKHVTIVTGRVIHFRDATGFHLFKNGECSCRNCW